MAKCRVPGRYILLALLFVGNTILSTHKFDLGIAILAMTNRGFVVHNVTNATAVFPGDGIWLQGNNDTAMEQPISSDNVTGSGIEESKVVGFFTTTSPASPSEGRSGKESARAPVFSWSPSVQGVILGAYFYGVITPQVLGGRLAERFSAKWTLLLGLLASSGLTSATPWVATLGVAPLVVQRVLLGLVHGLSMPSSVALVARWAPRRERSTFVALLFCGRYMGIVVATLMFGHLSVLSVAGGWPFAFYMSGLLGFLWLALWYLLAFNDPACDPKVTASELRKIRAGDGMGPLKASAVKRPMPWRAVLTSAPVWALVVARFTNMWVSMLLFTKLPAYVQGVLGLSLHENANFSAVVFAFTIVSMLGSGMLADCLLRCGLETTLIRKAFQLTGCLTRQFHIMCGFCSQLWSHSVPSLPDRGWNKLLGGACAACCWQGHPGCLYCGQCRCGRRYGPHVLSHPKWDDHNIWAVHGSFGTPGCWTDIFVCERRQGDAVVTHLLPLSSHKLCWWHCVCLLWLSQAATLGGPC